MRAISMVLFAGLVAGLLLGCSGKTGDYAAKGAGRGAMAGAVGGLLSAVVFGGDPLKSAAQGAVIGGGVGATAGAIAGSEADKAQEQQQEAMEQRVRRQIGDDSFEGLAALADCEHDIALRQARKAARSSNNDYATAGLWLEALTYADQRQESKARAMYPALIKTDVAIRNEGEAEQTMRDLVQGLSDIRAEYGLPRVCKA